MVLDSRKLRTLSALLLVCVTLALPGCFTLQRLFGGLDFELPETMPMDFEFGIERRGARAPELDYLYRFSGNGVVEYRVRAPGERARPNEGSFEISGNEMLEFYNFLRDQEFADHAPDSAGAPESSGDPIVVGESTFFAWASGREKTVSYTDMRLPPDLRTIHDTAFALVPARYRTAEPADDGPKGRPERFVGDVQTKVFYPSDVKAVDDVPPERRVFFRTPYEAVDHGYYPDPESRPFERWKSGR